MRRAGLRRIPRAITARRWPLPRGIRGIPAYIVVPANAPRVKRAAIEGYGGIVTECASNVPAREAALAEVVARTGAHFVAAVRRSPHRRRARHRDGRAAGAGRRIWNRLWVPVGGGGLASGAAVVARALDPRIRVVAAEPSGADDAFRSLANGRIEPMRNPVTIADGLRTPLGRVNFDILSTHDVTVELASEAAIVSATRLMFERMKLVVEPSGAVPLAALLEASPSRRAQAHRGARIGWQRRSRRRCWRSSKTLPGVDAVERVDRPADFFEREFRIVRCAHANPGAFDDRRAPVCESQRDSGCGFSASGICAASGRCRAT